MAEIQKQSIDSQTPKVEIQKAIDTSNLTPEQLRVYEKIESLKKTLE